MAARSRSWRNAQLVVVAAVCALGLVSNWRFWLGGGFPTGLVSVLASGQETASSPAGRAAESMASIDVCKQCKGDFGVVYGILDGPRALELLFLSGAPFNDKIVGGIERREPDLVVNMLTESGDEAQYIAGGAIDNLEPLCFDVIVTNSMTGARHSCSGRITQWSEMMASALHGPRTQRPSTMLPEWEDKTGKIRIDWFASTVPQIEQALARAEMLFGTDPRAPRGSVAPTNERVRIVEWQSSGVKYSIIGYLDQDHPALGIACDFMGRHSTEVCFAIWGILTGDR